MTVLAFAPKYNRTGINPKTGKPWRDATGAFLPEAKKFLTFHEQPSTNLIVIDNSLSTARMEAAVISALAGAPRSLRGVAFFCHGFKNRIQFGFAGPAGATQLGQAIAMRSSTDVVVTFYACDAARNDNKDRKDDLKKFGGDNGFADRVRDALCEAGRAFCTVDSHTTAAHTTRNPHVRRFEGMGLTAGGVGGYYIVPRGSKSWKAWSRRLLTDFRFEYPYLSTADIHALLE